MATLKEAKGELKKVREFKKFGVKNLYLFKCNEFYKVGISQDVGYRLRSLQTGCPYKIAKIDAAWCYDAQRWESWIHEGFKSYGFGVSGEWYKLPDRVLEIIKLIFDCHGDTRKICKKAGIKQEDIDAFSKRTIGKPSYSV